MRTLEQINKIIDWYLDEGYKSQDIDLLCKARAKLAGLLYYLSSEMADIYKLRNEAEYNRKRTINEAYTEAINKKDDTGKRLYTVDQAKYIAEEVAKDLIKTEMEYDSTYQRLKLLLDACKEILGAINQYVSCLKLEKDDPST